MKEEFPGYNKKSDVEIKQIWENGIILFDTNVLLNLYRYSEPTRVTILDLISKFSDQIYLPHQAALEYNRNRYEVIAEQEKAYKEFLDKINQIQKDLQSNNKPPFLSGEVDASLNTIFKKVSLEVTESIKKYCEYLKADPIYDTISSLFENKITKPFDTERLTQLYKEGEDRYKFKIPPGFEDEKTKEGNNKFGDLILWKQVIQLSKELKKNVILVTDERKVDWWWKIKDGRTMGPRQELVQEIKEEANTDFHMYSSERFLSYGQYYLKEQINQKALDEISAMKKAEFEELKKIKYFEFVSDLEKNKIENKIKKLKVKIDETDYIINHMDNDIHTFYENNRAEFSSEEEQNMNKIFVRDMHKHRSEMENLRENYIKELRDLQDEPEFKTFDKNMFITKFNNREFLNGDK